MQLALYRYSLPFRQPLMFKGQRLAHREGLLVSINGQWGEIAPLPGFSNESLAEAEAESLACLTAMSRGEKVSPTLPSVQFGFDCAQRSWPNNLSAPLPPYPLLQGAPAELIESFSTANWQASPPSRLKLKVARYAMEEELALIEQLAKWLPATQLILDANGGWTHKEAQRFCERLPLEHIDYLEEPCAAFADTIAVADATGVAIALDETLSRREKWYCHPQLKTLVIKPMLIGSLRDCEALVQRARAGNLRVVISSSFESDLGLGLLARLASEWAPNEPPGLDTGHWLTERIITATGEVMTENLHCLSKMEKFSVKDTCPIHYWAKETPTHIAIEAGSVMLSYRTLNRRVASLAQQLARKGFVPGDRLVVPAKGSLESLLLAWACLRAGVVFCPLNPAFPVTQQLKLANRLQADRVCQTESDDDYSSQLTPITLDFLAEANVGEPTELDGSQLCNTIFTSGSSGTPKAVLHSVANHLASARGSASFIPIDQNSGWLLSLPLFHIGGYAIPFRVFLAGGRVILDDDPQTLPARLEQQSITHLSLVPTQLWRLLKAGFTPQRTQLRELLLGGAAIPAPLVAKMTSLGLTPKVSYGLSEMASQVCTGIPTAPGVVGRPLPGREVRIVEGEIQVRGETLFSGYLNHGEVDPALNGEGWFATRDKGHFTSEGALVVEGRLDNGFISGGENIQPEAIEQRLVDHPSVAQALVVPVPHPEWGERPVAFIDWHGETVTEQALSAWVRETLPGFIVPDAWLAWPPGVGFKPSRKQFSELARAHANLAV